jgi:hypothetical protein
MVFLVISLLGKVRKMYVAAELLIIAIVVLATRRLIRHYPFWRISLERLRFSNDRRRYIVFSTDFYDEAVLIREGGWWRYRVRMDSICYRNEALRDRVLSTGDSFQLLEDCERPMIKGWLLGLPDGYRLTMAHYNPAPKKL